MRQLQIETTIHVYTYTELDAESQRLYHAAQEAAQKAYAPYSHFQVGAALLLDNGELLTGSNQENASYPAGCCAERTALFYAGAHYPSHAVSRLAIVAFNPQGQVEQISPCGICRQVLLETEQRQGSPISIWLFGQSAIYRFPSATSLLPFCFGKEQLGGASSLPE